MKTTQRIKRYDTVTEEQIAALGDVVLDGMMAKVSGYTFRLSTHSDTWSCSATPQSKAERDAAEIADAARSMPWHEFVCWCVARKTARKAHDGYTVRKSAAGWSIIFAGSPMVDRDASTVYSWLERLPLLQLSREADQARNDAFGM